MMISNIISNQIHNYVKTTNYTEFLMMCFGNALVCEVEVIDSSNEGVHKNQSTPTPHIHIAHNTPYWLAHYPTATHDGSIWNLHTFVNKDH